MANQGKAFDKDFWLAERNFLMAADAQSHKQKQMVKQISTMWEKAIELEYERIAALKILYENVLTKREEHHSAKKLVSAMNDIDQFAASKDTYIFK